MAKLSGVEIIIIIGVGFAVFVILFIVAHRQIARFKVRDLLSKPLLRASQLGASPAHIAHIQRRVGEMLDLDVQPQMWDDHWLQYFKLEDGAPNYIPRAKALDCCVLLKLELLRFGRQFDWTAFEDLGEYFDRLKSEYPIDQIPPQSTAEISRLYHLARFDDAEFGEPESDRMIRTTREILGYLRFLNTYPPPAGSSTALNNPSDNLAGVSVPPSPVATNGLAGPSRRESSLREREKEKAASKKFLKGYELLESDAGSMAGSVLTKKERSIGSLAKLKRVKKTKQKMAAQSSSWEEEVPLHDLPFHDNPLINFEPTTSSSLNTNDRII